jgi:alanyl-tRNA synthetase
VFRLYDTYGFPVDLTNDIARERGLTLDIEGYEAAMAEQRQRSQESGAFKVDYNATLNLEGETEFLGYQETAASGKVVALLKDNASVEQLSEGESGVVVLDRTPFYGESGGQVGDCGYLRNDSATLEVRDTTKAQQHHLHHVQVTAGSVRVGDTVDAEIDAALRQRIRLNHSATHLLHAALRKHLGDHVTQKGSLVDGDKLRFDFAHGQALTADDLVAITEMVNAQIRANTPVTTQSMSMDAAIEAGAMALFGEKYGDEVRVLTMGTDAFSVELCGGTHVERTGDIGLFLTVNESGVASGVRRIEAITGQRALDYTRQAFQKIYDVQGALKATPDNLVDKAVALRDENRALEKEIARLKQKLATSSGGDLTADAVSVGDIKVLAARIDGADVPTLRDTLDQCKNKLGSSVVLLAAAEGGKISLVAGVSKDLTDRIKAGDLMREYATRLGGKGGGRPDMAQGGGTDEAALPEALASLPAWVEAQLGN